MGFEAATLPSSSKKARTAVEMAAAKDVARARMKTPMNGVLLSRTTGMRPKYAARTALKREANALRILFCRPSKTSARHGRVMAQVSKRAAMGHKQLPNSLSRIQFDLPRAYISHQNGGHQTTARIKGTDERERKGRGRRTTIPAGRGDLVRVGHIFSGS